MAAYFSFNTQPHCFGDARTTEALSISFCPQKTGLNTVDDQGAFEFGEDAQHLKQGSTRRSRRVDGLTVQIEVDASVLDLGEEADQFSEGPGKPVDAPDCDHVDLTPGDGGEQPVVARPLLPTLNAAGFVSDDLADMPAQPVGHGSQVSDLVSDGLTAVRGRYAAIQGDPFAGRDINGWF